MLLALGPGGVHAPQRAPQRRRVHVAPRGDTQHDVVPAATPRSSIAASETFGHQPGPTYGNRFRQDCLASQQPSTKPRSGSTPSTGSTPSAGHRGRGRWPARCACSAQRVLCARLRLKNQRMGLRAYSMTPGATRLSKLVGCTSSRGSRRTAPAKSARCPQRPASPAPHGPACRCPSARSLTARTCPARPGSSASPPRRALVVRKGCL